MITDALLIRLIMLENQVKQANNKQVFAPIM